MRTSFHHQPEAQHPNFQLSTSWQADYPISPGGHPDRTCSLRAVPVLTPTAILRVHVDLPIGQSSDRAIKAWYHFLYCNE